MDSIKAIVLAAGKGTRLHSAEHNQPKALREAAGKPLLHYVLSALDFLPKENTVIVAGYMREQVEAVSPTIPSPYRIPSWAPAMRYSVPGTISGTLTAPFWSAAGICPC